MSFIDEDDDDDDEADSNTPSARPSVKSKAKHSKKVHFTDGSQSILQYSFLDWVTDFCRYVAARTCMRRKMNGTLCDMIFLCLCMTDVSKCVEIVRRLRLNNHHQL